MKDSRLKIVGVQYAANPKSGDSQEVSEEMAVRTIDLLRQLEELRPKIVLMSEPTNSHNPNAVMARAMGKRIGYVSDEQLRQVHLLMQGDGKLLAEINEVVIGPHGYLFVNVCEDIPHPVSEHCELKEVDWSCWTSDVLLLAQTDEEAAEDEAQFMLDDFLLPHLSTSKPAEVSLYVDVWMKTSRYDVSYEAREACNRYIELLISSEDSQMRTLAEGLIHHRTSMCSRQTNSERVSIWWKGLLASDELEQLWGRWQMKNEGRLWDGLYLIDSFLRNLPGELYQDLDRLGKFFSRLYYMKVPREALKSIVALLLLREKSCMALSITMRPLKEGDYQQDGVVTDPLQIPTTIGRVMEYQEIAVLQPIQRQTIQNLCYWLRDDYEQRRVKEIEEMGKKDVAVGNYMIQNTYNAPVGQVMAHVEKVENK